MISTLARSQRYVAAVVITMAAVTLLSVGRVASGDNRFSDQITPVHDAPPLDAKKLELGATLFADPILSGKGKLACSSCHDLATSGTVNLPRTIGYQGEVHNFNAPTIFNVANNYRLGWRGNFISLAAQNEQVLLDRNIMANDWPSLLARLRSTQGYNMAFRAIYGAEPTKESLLDVLVSFQLSLATPDAPFDRYLKGQKQAISAQEKKGYDLFQDYGCISCHQGSNIGGNLFQKFGVFAAPPDGNEDNEGNLGRFTVTHEESDKGFFRVPSLRNVAVTAPYFHDGRTATLEDAVRVMGQTQVGYEIPADDVASLVAFLRTLTGEYKGVPLRESPATNYTKMSLDH